MVFGTAAGHGHLLFTITFTSAFSLWLIRTPTVQPHAVQLVGLDSAPCRFSQHLQPRCTRTYLYESSQLSNVHLHQSICRRNTQYIITDAIGAVDICAISWSVLGSSHNAASTSCRGPPLRGAKTIFCVRRGIPQDVKRLERTRVAPFARPEMLITQIAEC